MAGTFDFKYGTLFRTGPRLQAGGKWNAELNEDVRNGHNNADLTISIRIHFQKIDPANRRAGQYPDTDNKPRRIQRWAPGEFECSHCISYRLPLQSLEARRLIAFHVVNAVNAALQTPDLDLGKDGV